LGVLEIVDIKVKKIRGCGIFVGKINGVMDL